MKIHREGYGIIRNSAAIIIALSGVSFLITDAWIAVIFSGLLLILLLLIIRFFRVPDRKPVSSEGLIFAPADGTVVVIEQTDETEYLNEKRIQVSIFMSIWNVHINWFAAGGRIEYFKHHNGSFNVAWHPKSSEENERTTTVIDTGHEKILFRQVAGFLARRIVSYAKVGKTVAQNSQCGFIKFGSRVDIFLPLDAEILIDLEEKVVGTQTAIARLKR